MAGAAAAPAKQFRFHKIHDKAPSLRSVIQVRVCVPPPPPSSPVGSQIGLFCTPRNVALHDFYLTVDFFLIRFVQIEANKGPI
jgi:hypothetical protein